MLTKNSKQISIFLICAQQPHKLFNSNVVLSTDATCNIKPGWKEQKSWTPTIDGAKSVALSEDRQCTWAPAVLASSAISVLSVDTQTEENPVKNHFSIHILEKYFNTECWKQCKYGTLTAKFMYGHQRAFKQCGSIYFRQIFTTDAFTTTSC